MAAYNSHDKETCANKKYERKYNNVEKSINGVRWGDALSYTTENRHQDHDG